MNIRKPAEKSSKIIRMSSEQVVQVWRTVTRFDGWNIQWTPLQAVGIGFSNHQSLTGFHPEGDMILTKNLVGCCTARRSLRNVAYERSA
jgi:hypothetical protein